jgi:hypothetical protein
MATTTALASSTSSPATSGSFVDALGNLLAGGNITMDLNVPCSLNGGGEVVPRRVVINLDSNAKVASGQAMFRNTDLTPNGSVYLMQVWDAKGNLAGFFGAQSIVGSAPIDLALLTPTSVFGGVVSYPNAVLQSPSAQQTINGQDLVMEGAGLGFSPAASTVGDVFFSRRSANVAQVGSVTGDNSGAISLNTVRLAQNNGLLTIGASSDTGISRDAAGVIDIGNGTQGDTSGTIKATTLTASSTVNVATGARLGQAGVNQLNITLNSISTATFEPAANGLGLRLGSAGIYAWSSNASPDGAAGDTGVTRTGAAAVAIGNGAQGDFTGQLKLGNEILTSAAPTVAASQVGIGSTTSASATAGGVQSVPATVAGYLVINVAGTSFKVPYFAV